MKALSHIQICLETTIHHYPLTSHSRLALVGAIQVSVIVINHLGLLPDAIKASIRTAIKPLSRPPNPLLGGLEAVVGLVLEPAQSRVVDVQRDLVLMVEVHERAQLVDDWLGGAGPGQRLVEAEDGVAPRQVPKVLAELGDVARVARQRLD